MWIALLTAALAGDLTVVFGSCAHQRKPQPIWRAIDREAPDAVVLLGDNVYVDSDDPSAYSRAYSKLDRKPAFRRLRSRVPLYVTWDDHDYGRNDAGAEWPLKEVARSALLDFLDAEATDLRRVREDGLYGAWTLSTDPTVQLILLDTRWSRGPLTKVSEPAAPGGGPYRAQTGPEARMLGAGQWAWLEAVLSEPADVRLVGSSIPVLPHFTGWETWANLPDEQSRLLELLSSAGGSVLLSGDTHWGELSRREAGLSAPLWELTSSGLTQVWRTVPDNLFRHDDRLFAGRNYGRVVVAESGTVIVSLHDARGREVWSQDVTP